MTGRVSVDDDVVQQNGVGAPVLQIDERLLDAFIGDRVRPRLLQRVPRLGGGERPDPEPA